MRVTLDTAILIRGNAKAGGPAKELLEIIQQTDMRLVLSPYLLEGVQRVLRYPRVQSLYQMTEGEIGEYIQLLESIADVVLAAEGPVIVLKDPHDDPVVYTALAGQADILCTVDKHFYEPDVLAFCSRHGIRVMPDIALLHFLRGLKSGDSGGEA